MRERDIEKYLVDQCKRRHVYCRKWAAPGMRGVPDRILLVDGNWWAVEVKAPGRQPTKLQLLEHKRIRKHGGNIAILDSKKQVDLFLDLIT
jgi:hypothetical protein